MRDKKEIFAGKFDRAYQTCPRFKRYERGMAALVSFANLTPFSPPIFSENFSIDPALPRSIRVSRQLS